MTISLSDGQIKDRAYLKVRSVSKNTLDDWDAPKLNNDLFDLYTVSEDQVPMAINSLNNVTCTSSFKLGIKDMEQKSYTLTPDESVGVFSQYSLTLIDNYTNQKILFNSPYSFTVDSNPLSSSSDRFTLQVGPKIPAAPVSLTYAAVLCKAEDTSIQLTASTNTVQYQLLDSNNQLLSQVTGNGSDLSLSLLSPNLSAGVNTFKVQSVSSCGTVYESKDVQITIEQSPAFSTTSASSCGPGMVTLGLSSVPQGYSVNWYNSLQSQDIVYTGVDFQTPVLDKTSTYYASLVSSNGCVSSRMAATATIINIAQPVITLTGNNILNVNATTGIQWYFNNSAIDGATQASIIADQTGTYSVQTTADGCSTSASYDYLVTGIEKDHEVTSLYPNPVERYLYVKDNSINENDVVFFDNLGKSKTAQAVRDSDIITIDMENFSAGMYYMQVVKNGKFIQFKIIKK